MRFIWGRQTTKSPALSIFLLEINFIFIIIIITIIIKKLKYRSDTVIFRWV